MTEIWILWVFITLSSFLALEIYALRRHKKTLSRVWWTFRGNKWLTVPRIAMAVFLAWLFFHFVIE